MWLNVLQGAADFKELIPEFYQGTGEFMINSGVSTHSNLTCALLAVCVILNVLLKTELCGGKSQWWVQSLSMAPILSLFKKLYPRCSVLRTEWILISSCWRPFITLICGWRSCNWFGFYFFLPHLGLGPAMVELNLIYRSNITSFKNELKYICIK